MRVAGFGPEHGLRSSASALRDAVADLRPSVVHTHLSYADVVGALVKPHGTALVTTEHGIADDDLVYHGSRARSQVRGTLHRLRVRRADTVIAVSEATLRVARAKWRIPASVPTTVIHNGIDPTRPGTGAAPGPARRLAGPAGPREAARPSCSTPSPSWPPSTTTPGSRWPGSARWRPSCASRSADLGTERTGSTCPASSTPAELLSPGARRWPSSRSGRTAPTRCSTRSATGSAWWPRRSAATPRSCPAQCLVDPADTRAVADALVRQGRDLAAPAGAARRLARRTPDDAATWPASTRR